MGQIEDPLEQPANSARAVSGNQLNRIAEAFYTSHELLTSPNQTRTALVRSMVRQQIWGSFLPREVQNYYPNSHPAAQHQFRTTAPRPVGPPYQGATNSHIPRQENQNKAQPSVPKSRGESSYSGQMMGANGSSAGAAAQASASQGHAQQVWRPKNVTLTI